MPDLKMGASCGSEASCGVKIVELNDTPLHIFKFAHACVHLYNILNDITYFQ